MAGKDTLEITDANFEAEVLNSDVPVIVDFWAEWCGPCRMLGPVIDELASENVGKVKVGKVDTDNSRETAAKFNITSIPTIIFFKGGEVVKQNVGMVSKGDLQAAIDEIV